MECGNWSSLEKKKRGRLYQFFSTSTRSKTIPLYSDQKDSSASDFFCFLSLDLKPPRMHSARPSGLVGASSAAIASEECSGNNWDSLTVVQRTNFTESNRMSSYSNIRLTRDRELSDLAAGAAPCHDGRSHEDMGGGHLPCHSPGNNSFQNMKAEMQQDVSLERYRDPPAKDEKKQKNELNPGSSNHKASSRNGKVSENADASKDDYIHVRSKRGQATNIHSLAERVRREKISERMKLLQDLVPGCNKINGKAMMLDEIINYVQSLQRQVEFLSMKLAAVHPEMNFDLHQILPQDALRSCYSGSSVVAVGPGMSNFHSALYASSPYQRITRPEMPYVAHNSEDLQHSPMLQVSQLAQNLPSPWQDELHNMNPVPNEAATDQMHW